VGAAIPRTLQNERYYTHMIVRTKATPSGIGT